MRYQVKDVGWITTVKHTVDRAVHLAVLVEDDRYAGSLDRFPEFDRRIGEVASATVRPLRGEHP